MNIIHGIPSGGGANYVLSKNSADDFDVSWKQSQYVGKNLLINSDFRFPVNQQGKLTYTVTDELEMTVDMWVKYGGTNYTIDVTSDGLQVSPNAGWVGIETRVEGFYLTPGNYTFSFLISNPSTTLNRSFHTIIIGTNYDGTSETLVDVNGGTLSPNVKLIYIVKFTITKQHKYIRVIIGAGNSTATNPFIVTACKLEKGNFQTLCYDSTTEIIENPPNFNDSLNKIYRYFIVYPPQTYVPCNLGGGIDYEVCDLRCSWMYRIPDTSMTNRTNMLDLVMNGNVITGLTPSAINFVGRTFIQILLTRYSWSQSGNSGYLYFNNPLILNAFIQ